MGELRPGWRRVKFGDVVQVVTDYWDRNPAVPQRFVAGEHIDEGVLRVSRWGMTSDDVVPPTFNRRFQAGDVLFHSRNLKKVACPDFDGITGEKLFVLRPSDPGMLLPDFLPFLLQSRDFDEYVNRMWAGSTNKFLNKAPLVRYEFALPPLDEQRRIARIQIAAADAVTAHGLAVEHARRLAESLHHAKMSAASESYARHPLPDLCSVLTVGIVVTPAKYYVESNGVPVLRSLNVWPERFDLYDLKQISVEGHELHSKSLIRAGDVVVVRTGDPGRPGNAAVVPSEMDGWNCVDLVLARPKPVIRSDFLSAFMNWRESARTLQGLAPGTKQKHLSVGNLTRFFVPVPPVGTQAAIMDEIEAARASHRAMIVRAAGADEVSRALSRAALGAA